MPKQRFSVTITYEIHSQERGDLKTAEDVKEMVEWKAARLQSNNPVWPTTNPTITVTKLE